MASPTARSPHEKNWMKRHQNGRFDVTAAQAQQQARRRNSKLGYQSMTTRLMNAAGRPARPAPAARPAPIAKD